jgi:hypothetical protein
LTITKRLKVGKHNALSGDTAPGRENGEKEEEEEVDMDMGQGFIAPSNK